MQKIIAIVGPTASGKTGLSIELAKRLGAEIVSADSMQIYREMNIGTAKPSLGERQGIRHHLLGHMSVEDSYSVVAYAEDAKVVLQDLARRGIVPIICGGTGLYMDHLLMNTNFFEISVPEQIRENLQKEAEKVGLETIYERLKEVDPILAKKLHPNDSKRVIRGLEVYEATGKPLSAFQRESIRPSDYEVLYIGLNFADRNKLYARINQRVDLMMEMGLEAEVRGLLENKKLSATARAAIGYKELMDAIENEESIETAVELIKQKSRNYAKRQLTWFKKNSEIHWFNADECEKDQLMDQVHKLAVSFLKGC